LSIYKVLSIDPKIASKSKKGSQGFFFLSDIYIQWIDLANRIKKLDYNEYSPENIINKEDRFPKTKDQQPIQRFISTDFVSLWLIIHLFGEAEKHDYQQHYEHTSFSFIKRPRQILS
jgi:hypothetical protein